MSSYDFYDKFFGGRKGDDRNDNDCRDSFYTKRTTADIFENENSESKMENFGDKMELFGRAVEDFFEKEVNELMKSIFTPDLFPGFGNPNIPAIEENIDPRDRYLKPGCSQTKPGDKNMHKEFGKGSEYSDWLSRWQSSPSQPAQPHVSSSFKSVTKKIVVLPDGTVKTEEIIRNPDGTEQRTESHTLPNGYNPHQFDFGNSWSSVFFNNGRVPQGIIMPEVDWLKPGFENISPDGKKIDKDLDKEIVSSGIKNLPSLYERHDVPESKQDCTVKGFTRRTVTLPNGVVESEEIIHNSDGTDQRTVTQMLPDDTHTITTPLKPPGLDNDKFGNMGLLSALKDLMGSLFK